MIFLGKGKRARQKFELAILFDRAISKNTEVNLEMSYNSYLCNRKPNNEDIFK